MVSDLRGVMKMKKNKIALNKFIIIKIEDIPIIKECGTFYL